MPGMGRHFEDMGRHFEDMGRHFEDMGRHFEDAQMLETPLFTGLRGHFQKRADI